VNGVDDDLTSMTLSDNVTRRAYSRVTDHDEAEMLLETYLKQTEEVLARIDQVDEDITSTEDIINISLDSQRNEMLLLELRLTMGTFAAANGAFIASLFGMNLLSGFEESPIAFWAVTGASSALAASVFLFCIKHLKRLHLMRK
jgi:magnesium transporter